MQKREQDFSGKRDIWIRAHEYKGYAAVVRQGGAPIH